MKNANEYQADGFVRNCTQASLAEVNRQIASARNATPEQFRDRFRSQIRFIRKDCGYAWYWVLK